MRRISQFNPKQLKVRSHDNVCDVFDIGMLLEMELAEMMDLSDSIKQGYLLLEDPIDKV